MNENVKKSGRTFKSDTSLEQYFLDIRKYPTLNEEQTLKLFQRRDYFVNNGQFNEANKLNEIIVKHNLKLVITLVQKYKNYGLDICDLIQEGNIILIKAVEKFDYKLGFKFSTLLGKYIKNSIFKSIGKQTRNIKISEKTYENINKCKAAYYKLFSVLNREPSLEDISMLTGLSVEKITELRFYFYDTISLDGIVSSNKYSNTTLDYFIRNSDYDLESIIIEKDYSNWFYENVLNILSFNEKYVIIHRYGLFNCECSTLSEIGNILNLSGERIRQIENNAKNKIKNYLENNKELKLI